MSYTSPYQPNTSSSEFKRVGMQAGRSILEKTIIYGAQMTKFIIQFIIDALKQVTGH